MNAATPPPVFRVLHLNAGNMMGGIESLLLTVASCDDATPEMDHQFALTFDDTFAARLRGLGKKVHLLPQVRLRYVPSIYQSRRQLRMLLDQFHFDAVVSHSTWIQLIFGDVVRESRIPSVFWMHGPFDGHWLQKLASFQPPDFAICNSHWTRQTLDRCYPRTPSTVIYAPVPPHREAMNRDETRAALGIDASEVCILIAARMEAWKGHFDLLRALVGIKSAATWRLLIAGAPNSPSEKAYFESLQREAAAYGNVQFLGYRTDIAALMAAADIYCQPNRQPEPFGIAYVEALHAGVPVVTSAIGGAREILNRSTGILVEPGDAEGLARTLSQLIENRDLRIRLGSAGPARAHVLCDPARQMRMLSETLQSVIERAGGASAA